MGHMSPASDLAVSIGELKFASPVGLGWRVDPERRAARGLSCFGVGCIEVLQGGSRSVARIAVEGLRDGDAIVSASGERGVSGPSHRLVRSVTENGDERVQLPNGLTLPVLGWEEPVTTADTQPSKGVVLQVGTRLPTGGWSVPAAMPPG